MTEMEIVEHKHGAVTVVRPVGPLVQPAADDLLSRMLELRTSSLGRLVLDASGISYLDSRGLEVLVEVAEALAQGGQGLKISGANEGSRFQSSKLATKTGAWGRCLYVMAILRGRGLSPASTHSCQSTVSWPRKR